MRPSKTAPLLAEPVISTPAAPSSGNARRYIKAIANRLAESVLGDTGSERLLGIAAWSKFWFMTTPQTTTAVRNTGFGGGSSVTGTISHPGSDKTYGYPANIVSAAGANATAQLLANSPGLLRGTAGDLFGGFFLHVRVRFPDASYDNTGASTGTRIWGLAGYALSNGTLYQNARGGTQNLFGFNRENVNGSNTDANWQFVTNNGTSVTVADTGIAFTIGHVYDLFVWCPLGSATIYWQINDVTAGTSASGSATATLPSATAPLNITTGLVTVDATARNYQFLRFFGEVDQG